MAILCEFPSLLGMNVWGCFAVLAFDYKSYLVRSGPQWLVPGRESIPWIVIMSDRRCTVWILGDQLLAGHPALEAAGVEFAQDQIKVVLIESLSRANRLPYHRKKLVLLFSAMRHFAARLQDQGYEVEYIQAGTFREGLTRHARSWRPVRVFTMMASEYKGRKFQDQALGDLLQAPVTLLPNTQFLTGRFDPYPDPEPGKRYVMEHFYRAIRRHFDLLLDQEGKPVGGQWNFDKENRKPLPSDIEPPTVPAFIPDALTKEVMRQVAEMEPGVGEVDGFNLAVTHEQAQAAFQDFLDNRLENFGPYEDAMRADNDSLFHSVLSPYLNIGLLEPLEMVKAVQARYETGKAPINSVEGFIRQIAGWREYIYWQYWRTAPGLVESNFWNATRPLPQFLWDGKTDLNCIRHVVERAIRSGYAHHIERLMVISNFCLLAGLSPAAVNNWFLAHFIDAYDWVMVPNVIGMGLHADGGLTATKPYIASANYINKMGDYCPACVYMHKQRTGPEACPLNTLYWNFLIENEARLRGNPRLGPNVLGLRYLDEAERRQVTDDARRFLGEILGG